MQKYHSKDEVLKQFGPPDEKKKGEGVEEWTYSYDGELAPDDSAQQDTVQSKEDTTKHADTTTRDTARADSIKRTLVVEHTYYVKFMFDNDGKVVGYKSQGVDFTKKKKGLGMKILEGFGIAAILIVIIGIDIASNGDINVVD